MYKDSQCESLFFVSIFAKKSYAIMDLSAISNGRKINGIIRFFIWKEET